MKDINDYINSNPVLKSLDYLTVWTVIYELIKDNRIDFENV